MDDYNHPVYIVHFPSRRNFSDAAGAAADSDSANANALLCGRDSSERKSL